MQTVRVYSLSKLEHFGCHPGRELGILHAMFLPEAVVVWRLNLQPAPVALWQLSACRKVVMASESEKPKGPRIRVRIPTMGGAGAAAAAGTGDQSAPAMPSGRVPTSPPSSVVRSREDDRARRLTFELEIGELPNVLQFLSTDRRTGKLDLTVRNQPNAGYVFFDEGAVYLARYRNYDGVEALARVVNGGRVRAVFTNGARSSEKNVDIPVSALLLEVLVRADELVASGDVDDAPPPPRFRVGTAGSPAQTPAVIEAITEPPPPGDESLDEPDADDIASTGYSQSHMTREKQSPPRSEAAGLSLKKKRVEAVEEVAKPASKGSRGFFRRMAALVLQLLIVAGIGAGGFVVWDRYFRSAGPVRPGGGDDPGTIDVKTSELDSALVKSWLKDAGRAAKEGRYDEADRLLEQILAVDSANEKGLALRRVVDKENAPAIAARLQEVAEFKTRELSSLNGHDWAAGQVTQAGELVEAGRRLLAAAQYEGALAAYRSAIACADQLLEKRGKYREAVAKHGLVDGFRDAAVAAGAKEATLGMWTDANAAEQEAMGFFAKGDFARSAESWDRAGVLYQRAAAYARNVDEVAKLEREFGVSLAACEGSNPSAEARRLIAAARAVADQAAQLTRAGDNREAKTKWQEALNVLAEASASVDVAANRRRYEDLAASAEAAVKSGEWQAARDAYSEILRIPGFSDNPVALRGVFQADKGLLNWKMDTAAEEGRWQDAKSAAEELLRIDAGNGQAAAVVARARERLVVRLNIQAVHAGKPVVGARAVIGGEAEPRLLPQVVELEMDGNYHVRVWAPPRGDVFFQSYATVYEARKPGDDLLVIELKAAGGPEKSKNWRVPGLNLEMAYVRPGIFTAGSDRLPDERPAHKVTISQPFWMGVAEVTNQHYRDFLEETGYDGRKAANSGYLRHFGGGSAMSDERGYPVCYVSWKNAMAFCEWLTVREGKGRRLPDGYVYRLPTEAEWEYCASDGGAVHTVPNIEEVAWYIVNAKANQPVQQLRANDWGLYDMLGNVWEMCYDYYGRYEADDAVDPSGPRRGNLRVMRGGSHSNPADLCRPAYRSSIGWTDTRANVGFRIVLAPAVD